MARFSIFVNLIEKSIMCTFQFHAGSRIIENNLMFFSFSIHCSNTAVPYPKHFPNPSGKASLYLT